MKPAVFYPYKATYTHELEYSIKSLKHVDHAGVYIIGDKPHYDVEATVIAPHAHTLPRSAYTDVLNKILTACKELYSDQLLCMNDDFFIMRPYNFTMYDRGDILDHIKERRRKDIYSSLLQNTYDYLSTKGYSAKDYTTHTPFLYDRKKLLELIEDILPLVKGGKVMSIRTLYGNIYNVPSETIQDVKNPTDYKDLAIISTNEHTFLGELGAYIRGQLDG